MTEVARVLSVFFGADNDLDQDHPAVAGWVDQVSSGWPDFPLILPRTGGAIVGGDVKWYVMTASARQARRVQEELTAWIGPTFSPGWNDRPAALDTRDPIEAAVLAFNDGPTFAFHVPADHRTAVRSRLERLYALWSNRPDRRGEIERRVGLLLRDFHIALASGAPETAEVVLRELEFRGFLTAENQIFLRITLLDARGQWQEIASHPRVADVAAGPRPWPVTRALITALYRTRLEPAESADDPRPFVEQALDLEQQHPELFRTRGPLDRPEVAKTFALLDAGHPERPLRTRVRVLGARGLQPSDQSFLEVLLAHGEVDEESPENPVAVARALLDRGEVDAAWDQLLSAPESNDRAMLLVQCAAESGTLQAAQSAIEAFDPLPESIRSTLIERSRRFARDLEDVRAAVPPTEEQRPLDVEDSRAGATRPHDHAPSAAWSWSVWFDVLHNHDSWPDGVDVARRIAQEGTPDQAGIQLADLVQHERDPEQQRIFLAALPHLLTWLDETGGPASAPVKRAVLEAICLQDLRGVVALDAALHVTEALVQAGFTPNEYKGILDLLEVLWATNAATETVGWLTELLELLGDAPADPAALSEAGSRFIAATRPFSTRIPRTVVDDLVEAATAVGAGDATAGLVEAGVADPIDKETRDRLRGKVVGLYTLTPSVANRVKRKLETLVPELRVVVNADHVRTDALDNVARTADVMIVMLRSAKHAATDAIERVRPDSLLTLRLGCRGSTRVLEEFFRVAQTVA